MEPVEPLEQHLAKISKNNEQTQFALSWGLYQIAVSIFSHIFLIFLYFADFKYEYLRYIL